MKAVAFGATVRANRRRMAEYYYPRPDVAEFVPGDCRVVVDVGCGIGLLGAQLKAAHPARVVYGIEPDAEAAIQARAVLDGVLSGPAESAWPSDWKVPDCLVFADVLEHMLDPWSLLQQTCARLPRGGYVVISLPNTAHYSVVGPLVLHGAWEYREQGILDRTHLRFFTRRTTFDLVESAGLKIDRVKRRLTFPRGPVGFALRAATKLSQARESRDGVRRDGRRLLDHVTLQYVIRARKPSS